MGSQAAALACILTDCLLQGGRQHVCQLFALRRLPQLCHWCGRIWVLCGVSTIRALSPVQPQLLLRLIACTVEV